MKFTYPPTTPKALPFIVLLLLSLGCELFETVESTKIPQSEIKQHFVVVATHADTHVRAYFTQGGWTKSVDLDAPSKIEHNGAELAQKTILFGGPVYERNFTGAETAHSFVYTNNDRRIFRNELSFQPLELLTAGEIAISRAAETRIRLSRAVGKDETVSIMLEAAQKPPATPETNAAPANNNSAPEYEISLSGELDESRSAIILKPKNLKRFAVGKAVLKLTIGGSPPLSQATAAGGTMNWSYSSTRDAAVAD